MIVGLTGGIGSGKTTVAKMFQKLGIPVYIADDEAKKLMETSKIIKKKISELLGEEAYSENLPNRKWIASKVFSDKNLLESLNAIIHPEVKKHFHSWVKKQDSPYVLYEAAILFEKDGYKDCDYSILVKAPQKIKIQRLKKRDNSSEEAIKARMNNQWSDEKKEKLADFVIENTDLESTKAQVTNLHERLLNKGIA